MFAALLCLQSAPALWIPAWATEKTVAALNAPGASAIEGKAVLILSGVQYGLPVSDGLIGGAVAILKEKGVSTNDIYVEYLDLARHNDPARRTALVALLREKLADKKIGLVIAQNQGALDFLAHDAQDLLPPDLPILSSLVSMPPVAWRREPHRLLSVINRYDIAGTLRIGLKLFPQTRQLVVVAGADEQQAVFHAQTLEALALLGSNLEVVDTVALSHEEMLQRISTLPQKALFCWAPISRIARDAVLSRPMSQAKSAKWPTDLSWHSTMLMSARG